MAIQQHPVPQDISNYKFRLIGDMTIRQFASLGIFIILSIIIYGSPIPFFFRYPLAFIFLITGIAMAFIPIQGRTLDVWIIAFIKSIYSPTQYVWTSAPEDQTPSTTTSDKIPVSQTPTPATPVVPITPPVVENPINTQPQVESEVSEPKIETPPIKESEPVTIPVTEPITVEPKTENVAEVTPPTPAQVTVEPITTPTASLPTIDKPQTTQSSIAPPTTTLPIPFTPTTPNTLVGLSLTPDGKILDGVLIEIKKENLTLRATKSNKLGQFLFARALENGLYQILAEKEGYTFTPYAIELNGEIVKPLKIQAN